MTGQKTKPDGCARTERLDAAIPAYISGTLDAASCAEIEQLMRQDSTFAKQVEVEREMVSLIRDQHAHSDERLGPVSFDALRARIERESSGTGDNSTPTRSALQWAAAVLLSVTVLFAYQDDATPNAHEPGYETLSSAEGNGVAELVANAREPLIRVIYSSTSNDGVRAQIEREHALELVSDQGAMGSLIYRLANKEDFDTTLKALQQNQDIYFVAELGAKQ